MKTLTLMKSAAVIASVAASISVYADLYTDAAGVIRSRTEWALPGTNDPAVIHTEPFQGAYLRKVYSVGASSLPVSERPQTFFDSLDHSAATWVFIDSSDDTAPLLRPYGLRTAGRVDQSYYATDKDTVIDADFVANNPAPFYSSFDDNASAEIALTEGESFYMAFWLLVHSESGTVGPTPGVPSEGDVYGWMELEYSGGELNLLRSAAQNDGTSIVVGQIPEPSSVLLLLLGGGGVALLRRFLRSTGSPYD